MPIKQNKDAPTKHNKDNQKTTTNYNKDVLKSINKKTRYNVS